MKVLQSPPAIIQKDSRRANDVLKQIEQLSERVSASSLDLAELLSETRRNEYYKVKGFNAFEEFVTQAKLGVGKRQAFYLIKIWDSAEDLTIPRDQLEAAGMTKLKHIFTLDVEKFEPEIRDLVERAPKLTVEQIEEEIKALKAPEEDEFSWMNFKIKGEDKEGVVLPALELARANSGDTIDISTKESKAISDGQALIEVCMSYSQDANNLPEQFGSAGTFEDTVGSGEKA